MIKLRHILFPLPFVVLACSSDDSNNGTPAGLNGNGANGSGNNTGASPPKATEEQVSQCKAACDQQKFFDCYDAAAQSICLQNCAKADTDQADQFIRCVKSETCDAECSTVLVKPPPTTGGSGTGGTGGGSAGTGGSGSGGGLCDKACDKIISCGEGNPSQKPDCVKQCEDSNAPDDAKQCVITTPCAQIAEKCSLQGEPGGNAGGGGTGPIDTFQCENTCQQITFDDCLPAAQLAPCKSRCAAATQKERDDFSECVVVSTGDCEDENSCYDAFKAGGGT